MKKIFITLLLLMTVVCSINFSTVATYADTPEDNQEVVSYTETVYPKSGSPSKLNAGEITVTLTQEGFKESTGVMIMTGTKIKITTAPGYIIKSVTLTSADTNDLRLSAEPELQPTKDSDKVWTLTGFEPGKNYEIDNMSSRAYKLYSVTVTYENHIHTEFTRTSDKNNHWDGCVCLYKLNVEEHDWDEGTVTEEPTHEANGTKTYRCSGCDRTKTESISPSLTDAKANITLSGALAYNGEAQTQGVVVTYGGHTLVEGTNYTLSDNVNTEVGDYRLTVTGKGLFKGEVELDYSIGKGTYDMSGVTFGDVTVTYDGNAHPLAISGNLPDGVTVTYENNDQINAGTHTVVAKFTGDTDKYNAIPDMEATLTVNKATYDMSGVTFGDVTVNYDGNAHSLAISGNLPAGVTVTYENNDQVNAGIHTVVAKFTGDANYNAIPDMTATLTIEKLTYDMSGVTFGDVTVTYDGNAHPLAISGNLPSGVTVTYENNGNILAGVYTVVAKFTGNSNYNAIPDMTATLTVNKATYDMSGVVFADKSVTHNGSPFSIEATNLPDGVTVTYENNGKTEPGKYTVTAKFTGDSNYNAIPDMTATLTVKQSSFTFLTDAENAEDEVENDFFVSCETGVDPDANLIVEMIETKTSTEDLEQFLEKNQRIGVAYDVKLLKDGATVQPDGTLQFKVLIPADLRGKDFEIMHIHAGSEKNILSYTIDGDYVIFETDKLSEFVFVYETGSLVWLVIVLACLALAEAGALVFLMNKNDKVKRVKLGAAYPPFLFGMFIPGWHIVCVAALAAVVVGLAAVDVIYALKLVNNTTSAADEGAAEE